MTLKSTILMSVVVVAGTGLFVAAWWGASRLPAGPSLADYTAEGSYVRHDLPATRPAGRMTLPWDGIDARAPTAGASIPGSVGVGPSSTPPPPAALPWGESTAGPRRTATGAAFSPVAPPAIASVAETAAKLKFSPGVTDWLGGWDQKIRAHGRAASSSVADFERLLATDNSTVAQLLSLLRVTQSLEDHPQDRHTSPLPPVSGAIACRAVCIGTDQARGDPKRRYVAMNAIAPLIERLWYGQGRDLRAVHAFYSTLAQTAPEGSPDWHRGQVGSMESLIQLRQYAEAMAVNDVVVDNNTLSPQQRSDLQFLRAEVLIKTGREAEALPLLRAVSDVQDARHAVDALGRNMEVLLRLDRIADARALYHRWSKEAMPSAAPGFVNNVAVAVETPDQVPGH